jgi:hypothetical protein
MDWQTLPAWGSVNRSNSHPGTGLRAPCQRCAGGQPREELPHDSPEHFGRERLAEKRDVGWQTRLLLGRPTRRSGDTPDGQTWYVLAEIVEEADRVHTCDSGAADEQVAVTKREVEDLGAGVACSSDPVAVATQGIDDKGGRCGLVVGHDDSLAVEVKLGRVTTVSLEPGDVREWREI